MHYVPRSQINLGLRIIEALPEFASKAFHAPKILAFSP
jgi:hypothetical protein